MLPQEWDLFLKAMASSWFWMLSRLRDLDDGRLKVMEAKFPNLSTGQICESILADPEGYAPISNIKLPNKEDGKSLTPDLGNIAQAPPPSGNG